MVGPIRYLADLVRTGGTITATCLSCGRVAMFAPSDLATYLSRKKLTTAWPIFARHLKCAQCGAKGPHVAWGPLEPPPAGNDDPPPPRPRFARAQATKAPLGIAQDAWDQAGDDRERRRLIRQARG